MSKQILIEQVAGEIRAALLEDERLVQFQVQPAYRTEIVGNIYRGIVRATKPALDAAFIDIGLHKHAFLPARDLPRALLEARGRNKALGEVLKTGQPILVQAIREAVGDKGTMVTGTVVLPGRFLVLTPEVPRSGVSRRLSEKERDRLHKILRKVKLPEEAGVIVRTAGEERTQEELERDLTYLLRLWKAIQTAAAKSKVPQLLFREGSLPIRFIREFMTTDVDAIRTNNERIYQDLDAFVNVFAPRCRKRVTLEAGGEPPFHRFHVEEQVEQLSKSRVLLPSGGSLVIDHTEALVAIDVNSGKGKGKGHEDTIYKTNLEAAAEIARQVILRDIGGLVVVDFIDMDLAQHRSQVEKELHQAFSADKARLRMGKISEFGLLEFSRQQLRPKLQQITHIPCPRCGGSGSIKSTAKVASELLMRIRNALLKDGVGRVVVHAAPEEARHLLNERRRELVEMEDATHGLIEIQLDPEVGLEQARIEELPHLSEQAQGRTHRDEFVLSMYSTEDIEAITADGDGLIDLTGPKDKEPKKESQPQEPPKDKLSASPSRPSTSKGDMGREPSPPTPKQAKPAQATTSGSERFRGQQPAQAADFRADRSKEEKAALTAGSKPERSRSGKPTTASQASGRDSRKQPDARVKGETGHKQVASPGDEGKEKPPVPQQRPGGQPAGTQNLGETTGEGAAAQGEPEKKSRRRRRGRRSSEAKRNEAKAAQEALDNQTRTATPTPGSRSEERGLAAGSPTETSGDASVRPQSATVIGVHASSAPAGAEQKGTAGREKPAATRSEGTAAQGGPVQLPLLEDQVAEGAGESQSRRSRSRRSRRNRKPESANPTPQVGGTQGQAEAVVGDSQGRKPAVTLEASGNKKEPTSSAKPDRGERGGSGPPSSAV
ncbi:MAG: Rne/Rng family ribonuclease [Bradymonadales bacterium]|nr:Rne/Rng family ribonuclease [Bradymonadales bacterium]